MSTAQRSSIFAQIGAAMGNPVHQHLPLWLGLLTLLAALAAWALTAHFAAGRALEEWTRDVRIALFTPARPQHPEIVILAINEDTMGQLSYRLPVDRGFLAEVVRAVDERGAGVIGIDFLLDQRTEEAKDEALRAAIAGAQAAVVPVWGDAAVDTVGERADTLAWFVGERTAGYGMALRDRFDGTVRRVPLIWNPDGAVRLHFAAALAEAAGRTLTYTDEPVRIDWYAPPTLLAPRQAGREAPPLGPFRQYPAHLAAALPREWIDGKVVLIGPSLADFDNHRTPFSAASWMQPGHGQMKGVELHAHILAQLLDGRHMKVPPPWLDAALILLFAALGTGLALLPIRLLFQVLLAAAALFAMAAGAIALWASGGAMLPIAGPGIAFLLATASAQAAGRRQERRRRTQISRALSHYLPPAVAERVERNPDSLELGGVPRTLTMLFTDLEGFSTLADDLPPDHLHDQLNAYLDRLAEIILKHGGTLDKFLGDGCMSFFGAPETSEEDAANALACALEIKSYAQTVTTPAGGSGRRFGRTRVGLDTGSAYVGNFGGSKRFDYTALGSVVNRAARLEAANRRLGTSILVSAETLQAAGWSVASRPAGTLYLFSNDSAVEAHEILGPKCPASQADYLVRYKEAFALLTDDPARAQQLLEQLAAAQPQDPLTQFYLARLREGITGSAVNLAPPDPLKIQR